jgi:hypothetical protein
LIFQEIKQRIVSPMVPKSETPLWFLVSLRMEEPCRFGPFKQGTSGDVPRGRRAQQLQRAPTNVPPERTQISLVALQCFSHEPENGDIPMANQNQPDPGFQNEGSKQDAMEKLNRQENLNRQAEKEQEEKLRKGGTDEITIKEGDSFIDGMPGYG